MSDAIKVLSWLHIGDLHIVAEGEQNHADLLRLTALIRSLPPGSVDFAVLPGDNADDGTPEQFGLVRDAVADLGLPLHILPGDHDYKPRSLDAFHSVLGAARLPTAVSLPGHRCVFLDVVSAGTGGPDFRLDDAQLDWLACEIDAAERDQQDVAVFMHTYPADLRAGAERLCTLLARPHVVCVDMGHTHYNELANDGRTVFMTTRSTGQIEEGPVGFSIAAIDGGVSWRFKALDKAWPLVLITAPTDHRLAFDGRAERPAPVRAKVIGDAAIEIVEVQVGAGRWLPMQQHPTERSLWEGPNVLGASIAVRARDAQGRTDTDRVEPALLDRPTPQRHRLGSDADRIAAWPEKRIVGTQLGPNRNGRKW